MQHTATRGVRGEIIYFIQKVLLTRCIYTFCATYEYVTILSKIRKDREKTGGIGVGWGEGRRGHLDIGVELVGKFHSKLRTE